MFLLRKRVFLLYIEPFEEQGHEIEEKRIQRNSLYAGV